MFKTEAQAKSALAFAQLSHIVADANGDWVSDWSDTTQEKHVIVSQKNELSTHCHYNSREFLPIKFREIALACLEKHRTLWEDFWMISK